MDKVIWVCFNVRYICTIEVGTLDRYGLIWMFQGVTSNILSLEGVSERFPSTLSAQRFIIKMETDVRMF